jgi:hypothetical protein
MITGQSEREVTGPHGRTRRPGLAAGSNEIEHDEPVVFKEASLALNPRARRAEPLPDLPNDHLPMTDCHDEAGSRRDTVAR